MKYVIHKKTRMPSYESYSGPTWDSVPGLRNEWRNVYYDKKEAERLAGLLSQHNPVGFEVSIAEN
jgi:hypothetical protein